jgi:beta-barrel assembly-enhancing protease
MIDEISNLLFAKGLDKNLELEADKYVRKLAYCMDYYPGGQRNFIRKLCKNSDGGKSIFMSSHPIAGERNCILNKCKGRYKKVSLYLVWKKRPLLALKRPTKL